ncbi:MAG: hypothetical protein L0206_22795, partial [Actinobacteria bacterium]|nr:hypothetical protein [Actinomycetota bacterium]
MLRSAVHRSFPTPLALLLVALGSQTAHAAPDWRRIAGSPIAVTRFEDFFFANPWTGWMVSLGGTIKTTDRGATWAVVFSNGAANLRCIGFANELKGWAGTLGPGCSSGAGPIYLYATTDGGATWDPVTNVPEPQPEGLCGIWVVDENVVYACGRYCGTPRVIKSIDGGANWTTFDMSAPADGLVDCRFFGPDTGIVVGRLDDSTSGFWRGVVLHTTDGGASWSNVLTTTGDDCLCWKISFPTREVGYVSVERFFNSPAAVFLKTTDGGLTWEEKPFPDSTYYYFEGIGFATPDVGWLGGTAVTHATTDGGETWVASSLGAGDDNANRFRFFHETFGYAVGKRLFGYWDNLAVGVADAGGRPEVDRFFLEAPRPNPSEGEARVSFTLPRAGWARLTILDASGRAAREIADRYLPPGEHTLPVDARGLPN